MPLKIRDLIVLQTSKSVDLNVLMQYWLLVVADLAQFTSDEWVFTYPVAIEMEFIKNQRFSLKMSWGRHEVLPYDWI